MAFFQNVLYLDRVRAANSSIEKKTTTQVLREYLYKLYHRTLLTIVFLFKPFRLFQIALLQTPMPFVIPSLLSTIGIRYNNTSVVF